jgi:DNA replicative helicase MCM subunit Mcm2 (Cdc46/Mcm family)
MAREGNTLSAVLRDAWDTGSLGTLTKNSPTRATGAHISLLSHSTKDELLKYLSSTEAGNGFANRFLWVCVRRSKLLPEGGQIEQVDFASIISQLNEAIIFARTAGEIRRDDDARTFWRSIYASLSEGKPGLFGSVTSRAEAQVVRLSLLYAVLDCSPEIRLEHLQAALAVWEYCESSAKSIFGDAVGNPEADSILNALREASQGLTRTQIRDLFDRHRSAHQIDSALALLSEHGLARRSTESTEGRSIERWHAMHVAT